MCSNQRGSWAWSASSSPAAIMPSAAIRSPSAFGRHCRHAPIAFAIDQRSLATWLSPADVAHLVDVSLRHPDPACMVINGYSNNTRLKTHDPNWATLGYQPRDNAEDYREMLRGNGVDVDAPDREKWAWREHGGSFARAAEHPALKRPAVNRSVCSSPFHVGGDRTIYPRRRGSSCRSGGFLKRRNARTTRPAPGSHNSSPDTQARAV
jgi:hypothetical protein